MREVERELHGENDMTRAVASESDTETHSECTEGDRGIDNSAATVFLPVDQTQPEGKAD